MITANDIKNFGMHDTGQILMRFDMRFTVNDILYECLGVGKKRMCVGYGTGTKDTQVVLLELEPVPARKNPSVNQQKEAIYEIATQVVNKIQSIASRVSDFELRDYILTEIETASKMAADCKGQDGGEYSYGVAMGRLFAASDMAILFGITGDEIGKIRTRYID